MKARRGNPGTHADGLATRAWRGLAAATAGGDKRKGGVAGARTSWSFLFMCGSFVLLLCNLYVTRTRPAVLQVVAQAQGAMSLEEGNSGDAQFATRRLRRGDEAQEQEQEDEEDISGEVSSDAEAEQEAAQEEAEEAARVPQLVINSELQEEGPSFEETLAEPYPVLADMLDDELFENFADYDAAPKVFVPDLPSKRTEWWGVQDYVRLYRSQPIKRFVPVLHRHLQMNQETFTERFRRRGQPVLFRGDNLRKAGYTMHGWTFDELREMFPFDKNMEGKTFSQYRPNAKVDSEEIDLGPGLAAIASDGQIVRKNGLRNFPRNMKVKAEALRKLGVQWPPLIQQRWRQRPSLWMGTSSSGTAFHSDCCDNFIAMIAGTKRITLAPPSDFHLLSPRCVGKNRGLCYANIPEPNKPGVSSSHYNKMIVDVKPGEILYLPAGWFHHIENLGPTLMCNHWTFAKETLGIKPGSSGAPGL